MNTVCHRANEELPDVLSTVANNASPFIESEKYPLISSIPVWLDENTLKMSSEQNRKLSIINYHGDFRLQKSTTFVSLSNRERAVLLLLTKRSSALAHLIG
jgi:hypothetical protein